MARVQIPVGAFCCEQYASSEVAGVSVGIRLEFEFYVF
jgi:hypothetical protein